MLSKKPECSVTFAISALKQQMFPIIRQFCVEILTYVIFQELSTT